MSTIIDLSIGVVVRFNLFSTGVCTQSERWEALKHLCVGAFITPDGTGTPLLQQFKAISDNESL